MLKFWRERDIFKKSLEKTQKGNPYIFYDGPPFATGLPHHGHLVGNILKDIVPRYWTMKGRYVERRFGWDCHGLPIEYEIDKKLGTSAQEAVKKIGVAAYNNECRSIVSRYVSEWQKTIERIGRWVDFENDYKTMDPPFMESVWWVFKQLWEKGLIYQGTRVVPFSTALGTVLSNFEAGQNYCEVQDPAITVLFKLKEEEAFIAAWTTTPWTLPSNLALCAGSSIDYLLVEEGEKKIYLAEEAIPHYEKKEHRYRILKKVKGNDLLGKRYHPLFPYYLPLEQSGAFTILNDDYVTTTTGTGIVHLAPGFGEDDNRVMKEANLADVFACPVDEAGKFTEEVTDFQGLYVKDADREIIRHLKGTGQLYQQDTLVHNYPFCYRSDTPLIYKAIPSWYVRVEKIKEKLLKNNSHIHWVPGHIKEGRFGKWLAGARDWSISRNRIWGTPLPLWQNQTSGRFLCIGSRKELQNYCGVEIPDLHREVVDSLSFQIEGEEGEYRRVEEVLDCWFESGSMPYAQLHYPFENEQTFTQGFPAEFIAEGLDQTRGWFYTLTVLASALFDKPAFKNVIVNGIVMAEDGKKMSKRLKNYTAPDKLMETYGADALRLYLINSGLVRAEEMRFNDDGVKDMVRRVLLPWYNSFKFFSTYAQLDRWEKSEEEANSPNIMDNWILSKLQTLKQNISREMENYHLYNVVPALFSFIEDLTNWYIRLNRSRFWSGGGHPQNDPHDKKAAYTTLFTCLKELSAALAPFALFLSEYIYRELLAFDSKAKEHPLSVHLCSYPEALESKIDRLLEEAMERIQQIILLGRQKRNEEKIKIKTPLPRLTCIHGDPKLLNEIKKLEMYIKAELNVKEVQYETQEEKYVELYAKPNLPVLGRRLGKKMGKYTQLIKNLSNEQLGEWEKQKTLTLDGEVFTEDDLLIYRQAKGDIPILSTDSLSIALDCQLTPALIREGMAREVVNRIQRTRKEKGFNVEDRVEISYWASPSLNLAIGEHKDMISAETLATKLHEKEGEKHPHQFSIDGEELRINIVKAQS